MPSPFRLTNATVDDVPMLKLSGDMGFGESVSSLHDAADQLRATGHTLIVLDLTDVETVDSTGISALLDARHILGVSGRVVLLRAPIRLRTSLDIARVAGLFELLDDEHGLRRTLARSHGDRK